MKNLVLVSLLAVLVSCGGSDSSKKPEGGVLDPVTQDKFEQHIRSLAPGMVTTLTSFGNELNFSGDTDGNWTIGTITVDSTSTETVLNVTGDAIYTLIVKEHADAGRATEREVKKESIELLIKEFSDPLPQGFSINIANNKLTVVGTMNTDWELQAGTNISQTHKINMPVNLGDIRCSERSTTAVTGKMVKNGVTSNLPVTGTTDIGGCGTSLTAAQLRAIDLSSIRLCDESTGSDDYECQENQDLSHLVQ